MKRCLFAILMVVFVAQAADAGGPLRRTLRWMAYGDGYYYYPAGSNYLAATPTFSQAPPIYQGAVIVDAAGLPVDPTWEGPITGDDGVYLNRRHDDARFYWNGSRYQMRNSGQAERRGEGGRPAAGQLLMPTPLRK